MRAFGSAVILAGGNSKRMGFDKQLIEIDDRKLVYIIAERLKSEFQQIIVVTNKPEYYKCSKYKIVTDEIKCKGALSGIHIGLKKAISKYVYFIACDMPNINLKYIRYIKQKLEKTKSDACITRIENMIEPFNSFYSKDLVNNIEKFLLRDERALYSFVKKINCHYIEEDEARKFSSDWSMFLNLNKAEDLEEYIKKSIDKQV